MWIEKADLAIQDDKNYRSNTMKRFWFSFVLLFMLVTINVGINGQILSNEDRTYFESFQGENYQKAISEIWLKICELNRKQFPDSNKIQPGDMIKLPASNMYYIAKVGGKDHMWMASKFFLDDVVMNFLRPNLPNKDFGGETGDAKTGETTQIYYSLIWSLMIGALIIFIAALVSSVISRKKKRREEAANPFTENPPAPDAPDTVILPVVRNALESVYGGNFKIIGKIERGLANGSQLMFHNNGTTSKVNFNNEPAFRALIEFSNKLRKLVVCRWNCFNPCFSSLDGEFEGTFTPEDGKEPEKIDSISLREVRETGENIRKIATTFQDPDLTEISASPVVSSDSEIIETKTGKKITPERLIKLTKLQASQEKGLTAEGNIQLTPNEFVKLVNFFQKKDN